MPNKRTLAESANTSRRSLYHVPKQLAKYWQTRQPIEAASRDRVAYGHKRLSVHLNINKKPVLRVVELFGIKPYGRSVKKNGRKPKDAAFPNLLLFEEPRGIGDIFGTPYNWCFIPHKYPVASARVVYFHFWIMPRDLNVW